MLNLKHTLELVEPLLHVLEPAEATLLQVCRKTLEDSRFASIAEAIAAVVHPEAEPQRGALNMRLQKSFAIQAGVNGGCGKGREWEREVSGSVGVRSA